MPPVLLESETHVWRVRVDVDEAEVERWSRHIDASEHAAAARKRFAHDRREVLVSHGALREVLALYCGGSPATLRFEKGEHGKPALAAGSAAASSALTFNLSHSGGVALIGVTRARAIGVDVEGVGRLQLDDALASRVLTARELELWRSCPASEQASLFLRAWTCKEAVVKAGGYGLSIDPRSFEVLAAGARGEACRTQEEVRDEAGDAWSVRELEVGDGRAAALAVAGSAPCVRTFDLPAEGYGA